MTDGPKKRRVSRGMCYLCGQEFAKNAMTRHLEKCRAAKETAQKNGGPPTRFFHLIVEGRDLTEYWLHLDARADATLADLDGLLRGMWLECCGHLSAFNVGRDRYRWEPPGGFADGEDDFFDGLDEMFGMPKERSLNVTLAEALPPGTAFTYEYDFGSTTELKGRVLSEHEAAMRGRNIAVLARNTPPEIVCDDCGARAEWVGPVDEEEWEPRALCTACIEKKNYNTDYLLPVVNSPRMGVCAYEGPSVPERTP